MLKRPFLRLSDEDGTFDILQYADPELNKELGTDFLDELVLDETDCNGDSKEEERQDSPDESNSLAADERTETIKTESNSEETIISSETNDSKSNSIQSSEQKSQSDFQAKFLEFSQMRKEEPPPTPPSTSNSDTKGSVLNKEGHTEKSSTIQNSRHIAALLQSSPDQKSLVMKIEPDLQNQNSSQSVKEQKESSPTSSMSNLSASSPKVQSTLQSGTICNSPIESLSTMIERSRPPSRQMSGMLPSPKDSLPKSGLSSPRTPSAHSPFGQVSGPQSSSQLTRHSPMSASTAQSPFSPGYPQSLTTASVGSVSSAGHTPPSAPSSRAQSPYLSGADRVIQYNQNSQSASTAAPNVGQSSPTLGFHQIGRGTVPPVNQYIQGTYGQPQTHLPPRGGILTPTPNSILYGQSVTNQNFLKHPQASPTSLSSGIDQSCINTSTTAIAQLPSSATFNTFSNSAASAQMSLSTQTSTGNISWPLESTNSQVSQQITQNAESTFDVSNMASRSLYVSPSQTTGTYAAPNSQTGLYYQPDGQSLSLRPNLEQSNLAASAPTIGALHRSPTPYPSNHPSLTVKTHIPGKPGSFTNQGNSVPRTLALSHTRPSQEQPLLIQDLLEEVCLC